MAADVASAAGDQDGHLLFRVRRLGAIVFAKLTSFALLILLFVGLRPTHKSFYSYKGAG